MSDESTATPSAVTLSTEGDVAVVRFDDGGVNAMSYQFLTDAHAAFRQGMDAKAVVIAGNGKCLSAGFDLTEVVKGPAQRDAIIGAGGSLFYDILTCPKPVVIACTGHAMAGGVVYLLTGDIRIGRAGSFKIGFNEVPIGVPMPDFGISLTHYRVANPMIERVLLGEVFNPESAQAVGLLDSLVEGEADDVVAAAVAKAAELAQLPFEAYSKTKLTSRRKLIEEFKNG